MEVDMKALHSSIRSIKLAAAIVAAASIVSLAPAYSQGVKKEQAATPVGAQGVMSKPTAKVEGFRSARFGMTEAEVKTAIATDFGIKANAVHEQPNAGERTKALLVKVPELLPGGGTAEVSYIFGYHTKKLIQISISWSKTTDEKMTPEQLFSNSSVLRAHFMSEGFKPETIASNMPISGGLLMFRGSDAKDHTTMLILQGTFSEGANKQRILTPASLLLFYVEDAKAPDVYRLPPGSF
jgi:hypothetical protein